MKIRTAHISGETQQLTQVLREAIGELEEHGETNIPIECHDGTQAHLVLAFIHESPDEEWNGEPFVEWTEAEEEEAQR